jgi:hypothetical protein
MPWSEMMKSNTVYGGDRLIGALLPVELNDSAGVTVPQVAPTPPIAPSVVLFDVTTSKPGERAGLTER